MKNNKHKYNTFCLFKNIHKIIELFEQKQIQLQ